MSCNNIYPLTLWPYASCSTPATSNCPPSPEPPWSRERRVPNVQTLGEDGTINLEADPTFLDKEISEPAAPVAITLPNGNYRSQLKTILIRSDKLLTTERFNVSGTFAGFTSIYFDGVGFNAILQWDGVAWQILSGNCNTVP